MMKLRTTIAVAVTAVLLAACSSSSSSSSSTAAGSSSSAVTSASASGTSDAATTYAESVCTDITTWQKAVKSESSSFQQDVQSATSPDDVKNALVGFLTAVVADTKTMVDDIQALGPPAVDGGADVHAAITQALTGVQTLFQTALDNVKSLDTSNQAALAASLQKIATDMQSGTKDLQDALSGIQNQDLDAAFTNAPACASL
jgi:hypothetical protein